MNVCADVDALAWLLAAMAYRPDIERSFVEAGIGYVEIAGRGQQGAAGEPPGPDETGALEPDGAVAPGLDGAVPRESDGAVPPGPDGAAPPGLDGAAPLEPDEAVAPGAAAERRTSPRRANQGRPAGHGPQSWQPA